MPQYMQAAVASMFEASASPPTVQNTLRVKYANGLFKLLEIPSLGVFRNHLRILRRSNHVVRRKVRTLEISDYVGDSGHGEPTRGGDMDVAGLGHFVDLHDFGRYANPRDSPIPPLSLLPGGDGGQHATLGHDLITSKQFGGGQCITSSNERTMVSTLVGCVEACWGKQHHVDNPERGHWEHRKYGVVSSCDDTYKISYEGDWVPTATVVVCTYLYQDSSEGGQAQWGVQHKAKVAMFQYSKAPTKKTLCDYMMGVISHVVHKLAHMEHGHHSGLGRLLPPKLDGTQSTLLQAVGTMPGRLLTCSMPSIQTNKSL